MNLPALFRSCLAGLLFAVMPLHAADTIAKRPNILWITAEDMSPDLGCFGDPYAVSPNINELAAKSIRYTRAFSTAPVCSPSRASLITGLYATTLGNPHLRCEVELPPQVKSYASYLRETGYFTANNVKADYNVRDEAAFKAAAWDRCDAQAHWRQRKPGQPFFAVFNLMETHQSRTSVWSWEEFEKLAKERLSPGERANPDRVPLPPFYPDTKLARRTVARYYDCIQMMDKQVGRILRELEKDGLADNTIVFFYSDHGMGLPRGKRVLQDSGLHVPLIVHLPKAWQHLAPSKPGSSTDRLVSFVDFAPTVLSLCGIAQPKVMQGVPFLGTNAGPARTMVYGARDRVDEAYDVARSVRDERWLYIRNYMPHLSWAQPEGYSDASDFRRELLKLGREGKLKGGAKAYTAPTRPLGELYDTQSDPQQLTNLSTRAEYRERVATMNVALKDWVLQSRDLGFIPEHQLAGHLGSMTPYSWARLRDHYPLREILDAADMVGRPGMTSKMTALMESHHDVVRWWAAVGLHAAGSEAKSARTTLVESLDDVSLLVRIECAAALVALDDSESQAALKVLAQALNSDELQAALYASRSIQQLGDRALPLKPYVEEVREQTRAWPNPDLAMYVNFSLDALMAGWKK
ncbi:MAG TPA: sulfatase-like hydrolase/transferase [Roseimicrobium sp.]|nr:sulfatase-like hydrolase/transferase [Roseimicrobium sp.]